jgi:hypothetical protein
MNKDEALKLALEALSPWMDTDADHTEQHAAYYAIKQALAAPVSMTSESAQGVEQDERVFARIAAMKKPPAAQPAPVPMAHIVGEIDHTGKVWKPVKPAIPDAIHHTDMSKTLEYIQGWNACRQATLEMMK